MNYEKRRRDSVREPFPRLLQMSHRAFLLPLTEKHTQYYLICNQNKKTQATTDDFCGYFVIFKNMNLIINHEWTPMDANNASPPSALLLMILNGHDIF